ncbi:MAG TPA: peptidase M4 family protein, partial [Arthrobacter sp.]|nr:peptidase M4 family protein [Arthrobacter sp.]
MHCSIIPPYMLRRLAAQREPEFSDAARAAKEALHHLPGFQASRAVPGPGSHPGMR